MPQMLPIYWFCLLIFISTIFFMNICCMNFVITPSMDGLSLEQTLENKPTSHISTFHLAKLWL